MTYEYQYMYLIIEAVGLEEYFDIPWLWIYLCPCCVHDTLAGCA